MKVRDLMNADVQSIHREELLPEAVEVLADQHVTALAVVDKNDRIIGVISTADVLTAQAESAGGPDGWQAVAIGDVMTTPPLTISPEASIDEAAQQLLYGEIHRLFVEDHGVLVGVISQTDLVRAFAAHRLVV